jgi:phosphate transport system substrate-binding protein
MIPPRSTIRGLSHTLSRAARCGVITACCVAAGAAPAQDFRIGGTGGALGTMQQLADAYVGQYPDIGIVVLPSLGSGGGIKAVLAGAIAIAVSARPLKESEIAAGAQAVKYARTPFIFATTAGNPTDALTMQELIAIYAGSTETWPDGARIRLVLRPVGDSDSDMIKSMSPAMREAKLLAEQRKGLAFAVTDQDAADNLEKIPGALGPSTLAQILSEQRALKALRLDGIEPSAQSIAGGSYPYYKTMYIVTTTRTPPPARKFIEFVQSAAGRVILERTGHWVE